MPSARAGLEVRPQVSRRQHNDPEDWPGAGGRRSAAGALITGDKKYSIQNQAILLTGAQLEPTMAPPGSLVEISVKLSAQAAAGAPVRVFARERRQVVELKPQTDGTYRGRLQVDRKTPKGATTVSIVALRAQPVGVKLPSDRTDPLRKFAEECEALNPARPCVFDPRVMVSQNRIDLPFTVLDPQQSTPVVSAPGSISPPVRRF